MNKKNFINQLQDIKTDYNAFEKRISTTDQKTLHYTNLMSRAISAVVRITGTNSEYYKEIKRIRESSANYEAKTIGIIGVVNGLLHDIKNDYIVSISELLHADVFSDFLEMAEHLLEEGYKDASAVIAGSALESHLRKMCLKNSLDTELTKNNGIKEPKKTDLLNSDLCKNSAYDMNYQKQITAWLGIRNDAAHAYYTKYDSQQVKLMIEGIRQFISKYPA